MRFICSEAGSGSQGIRTATRPTRIVITIPRPRMRTIAPLRTARGYITHSAEGMSNLRPSDRPPPPSGPRGYGPLPALPEGKVPGPRERHLGLDPGQEGVHGRRRGWDMGREGFEPSTLGLRVPCSTN